MWAEVKDGQVLQVIKRPMNIPLMAVDVMIPNINALTQDGKDGYGLYDYTAAPNILWHEEITNASNTVDDVTKMVTQVLSLAPKSLNVLKARQFGQVNSYSQVIKNQGVNVSGEVYSLSDKQVDKLTRQNAASLGKPRNVLDIAGLKSSKNKAQLTAILEAIADRLIDIDDNIDVHIAAIDLLSDGTDVINYDETTGWPA